MTTFTARIDGKGYPLPTAALCDAWLADGLRFGDELAGLDPDTTVLGRWPGELETDAAVRLAQAVGDDATWEAHAATPAVAQKLAERARPQPLDLEIARHLQHLQDVCRRPRLHLRVEEERLPVSRARRTPVRAVADLVSHPGDWEHRTLRSIQPSRVLARQIEDEWNLYENRVAVRLIDHLLAYLAKRLEELRKIKELLDWGRPYTDDDLRRKLKDIFRLDYRDALLPRFKDILGTGLDYTEADLPRQLMETVGRDCSDDEIRNFKDILNAVHGHGKQFRRTSIFRARRIADLWFNALESKNEEELNRTIKRLELAQRDLQTLLGAQLYQRVPRRQTVALSLKPTNILVNDPHYRKVAALWRAWVKYGYKPQETAQQRAKRRQREADAWDRFVLHLVVRGFTALGWQAIPAPEKGTNLNKVGWLPVRVWLDPFGVIQVSGNRTLRLLPLCAELSGADPTGVQGQLKALDSPDAKEDQVVLAHAGAPVALPDTDRASGWSIRGRAVLFACSPWGIDSEERMARLLHGWLSRSAVPAYPMARTIRALPEWPGRRDWLRHEGDHLVALRVPTEREVSKARAWADAMKKDLDVSAQRARAAKQAFAVAPREAVVGFQRFIDDVPKHLAGLDTCPVCGGLGKIEPRPGKQPDGSDATWWASCDECKSEWGMRRCVGCGSRYRALAPIALGIARGDAGAATDWPDNVYGRDLWAQPCTQGGKHFRCPECGGCSGGSCSRCQSDG